MEKTQHKWNVGINKTNIYREKSTVTHLVYGSFSERYIRICDYCHELLKSNPDSSAKVTTQLYQD